MKQLLTLLILFSSSFYSNSQESLNAFKYVLVENQYDFQRSENEFRLNEQIVFELKKKEFNAYLNNQELPDDLSAENCNTLRLMVDVKNSLATTMNISFIDCNDNVVYELEPAKSRLKNYEKDYRAALRKAMNSFKDYEHVYKENLSNNEIKVASQSESPNLLIPTNSGQPGSIKSTTYKSTDGNYTLKVQDNDFVILNNNNIIGTLKKSSSGCYLAVTTDFIGIGFQEGDSIKIEFEKQGTQVLEFKK